MSWLARHDARELTTVAVAPDLGERYLGTIYQASWFQDLYGEDVLRSGDLPGHHVREATSYRAGEVTWRDNLPTPWQRIWLNRQPPEQARGPGGSSTQRASPRCWRAS